MAVKIDGTSGIDTVKSSALTDKLGRRNYLINGNFDKWDYATSQTSAGYGSDNRWQNVNNGSTKTHSQVACGDTERALFNAMYFSRTKVTSSSGSSNYVSKWQGIENVNLLTGKTVTLSFWAKADANKNIAVEFVQWFGTGGSPSAAVNGIASQLVALTTTWQKKSITVNIPSISGKTLGSDGVQTTYTGLIFWFDAGSDNNYRTANLGQQSGTFDIAQVKIEDGSVATNGWHPYDGEFGGEVQACARYYESSFMDGVIPGTDNLSVVQTGYLFQYDHTYGGTLRYSKKRVVPSISIYSPLTSSCAGKVRRASNGDIFTVSNIYPTQSTCTFNVDNGVSESFQCGFTASAEL
jgi:hypothetical protein